MDPIVISDGEFDSETRVRTEREGGGRRPWTMDHGERKSVKSLGDAGPSHCTSFTYSSVLTHLLTVTRIETRVRAGGRILWRERRARRRCQTCMYVRVASADIDIDIAVPSKFGRAATGFTCSPRGTSLSATAATVIT